MRILLTGATGYLGGAIARVLKQAGHQVTGLARSAEKESALRAAGYEAVRGDLRDTAGLQAAAGAADAVVHAAIDMKSAEVGALDRAAVEALAATGKPLVYSSGIWVIGPTFGRTVGELTPLSPPELVAWRPAVEQIALRAGGVVLRIGVVFGDGGGRAAALVRSARQQGVVRFVGNGDPHWTWVHVDDAANAYLAAVEKHPGGEMFLIVDGKPVEVKALGAAIVRSVPGTRIEYTPVEEARKQMGPLADALVLDQKVASSKATRFLGWSARHPGVLAAIASDTL